MGNGIDRYDSAQGYVSGNVVPCCWPCNRAKGSSITEEFLAHVRKIASFGREVGDLGTGTALVTIEHRNFRGETLDVQKIVNLITNSGRIFLHQQAYSTSGLGANGLNFIALSNDALTETATSTTLSNEIVANGLARAQGIVTLPTGAGNQTIVSKTFTATGVVSAQKTALFTASSVGTMCHVLAFAQRTLQVGDQLQITYTITLG